MITEKSFITDPLPADVTALQALVRELQSELKISTLRCARLEYKMRDLIRRMYGPKSEKLNPAQRLLFGILNQTPIEAPATGAASGDQHASTGTKKKRGGGRKPKPQNLPVRRRLIDLPAEQKAGLVKIREEITEQIEYRPSLFFRRHIVRSVYACPQRTQAPIVAALPAQVIPQAGVGPGFLTHIVIAKYA